MLKIVSSLLFLAAPLFCTCSKDIENAFTQVYESAGWAANSEGQGCSGPGSNLENTRLYRVFLQAFLQDHNIRSVVDVGCGDWEFSQTIDWKGINYTGFDVVKYVIESNRKRFGSDHIQFVHGDATSMNLPKADLLICKEVLQHLSTEDVQRFLKQLPKFKYCLLTNDVNPQTFTSENRDICPPGYRTLDLTKPPFNLIGEKVLSYQANSQYKEMKQVLLVKPSAERLAQN